MASAVHILCALTSIACAFLLLRAYRRNRVRLLLWSGLCFIAFAVNNGMIFVDEHVLPSQDLFVIRAAAGLLAIALLLYGLVWEAE